MNARPTRSRALRAALLIVGLALTAVGCGGGGGGGGDAEAGADSSEWDTMSYDEGTWG